MTKLYVDRRIGEVLSFLKMLYFVVGILRRRIQKAEDKIFQISSAKISANSKIQFQNAVEKCICAKANSSMLTPTSLRPSRCNNSSKPSNHLEFAELR